MNWREKFEIQCQLGRLRNQQTERGMEIHHFCGTDHSKLYRKTNESVGLFAGFKKDDHKSVDFKTVTSFDDQEQSLRKKRLFH